MLPCVPKFENRDSQNRAYQDHNKIGQNVCLYGNYSNYIAKKLESRPENRGLNSVLEEFQKSAIPDRLTLVNITYIDGEAAIEALTEAAISQVQKTTSYVTKPAQGFIDHYDFARAGGWLTYGTTLDGLPGQVAYFKPDKPRIDFEKHKAIKYETPAKTEALPILPWVDNETAQAIYDRYNLTPQEGETFWQVIRRTNVPIAITEGLKKALALIAHGIPAIAIRGITQWHKKGTNELHTAIADFATPGRRVYILFDQDEKARTQADVRTQTLKLTEALEKTGVKAHVALWNRETGKGVDDALYNLGEGAQAWLDTVIEDAADRDAYKRDSRVLQALGNLKRLNTLTYPVERATSGEYLPQLPELKPGMIHVVSANQNAGKTTRIGADWVAQAHDLGWLTIVLSPTNATGQQTAYDWQLPHIHNYATDSDSQTALWAEVTHRGGIVLCAESLHRIPDWVWSKPVLLVLDEGNQVIEGLTQGDTLGSRYSLILEKFTAAARQAISTGAIVLSEDGLPDRAVNFIKSISGSEVVRVFTHCKDSTPWDCLVYRGQASGYRAAFILAAHSGKRLIYVASSQREAKRIERAIAKRCPARRVVRIDSETNQQGQFTAFFEQPDRWLQANQPDILILSPSAKSGVSIEGGVSAGDAYFSAVWGYFPALTTDTHSQLLGRYRPPVPRVVFCPDFILSSGDESLLTPRAIKRRLGLNARAIAGVYRLDEMLAAGDEGETIAILQKAVIDYVSVAKATTGNQKLIAHIALVERLKASGHNVSTATIPKDKSTVTLWNSITEEIWREEAQAIAAAKIDDQHTLDWARRALDSLDASLEIRILAQKVIWRSDFPGVLFNCPEQCYEALTRDYGAMARGVKLQAKAENLDGARLDDEKAVKALLFGNVKALHQLPHEYVRALMVTQSGVLDLLDGNIYSNSDSRCQRVKAWALRFSKEISYWLRLQVNDSQSPIEICHKLLRKLGLERDKSDRSGAIKMADRKGKRGQNQERFKVDLDFCPVRAQLLKAARHRISDFVTSIRNKEIELLQINVTESNPPQEQEWGRGVVSPSSPKSKPPIQKLDPYGLDPADWGDSEVA